MNTTHQRFLSGDPGSSGPHRPGYDFANVDDGIQCGHPICDKVAQPRAYTAVVVGTGAPTHTASNVRVVLDEVGDHWSVSGFERSDTEMP
jgi:hypothetical protein